MELLRFVARVSRSHFERTDLPVAFLLFASISFLVASGCSEKGETTKSITVVSYGGGAYQKSHIEAFFKPYESFTGIEVNTVAWGAEYGKLKEMVGGKNVSWDVVEVTDAQYKRGMRENLFQVLSVKPEDTHFLPNTISDYGIANVYWGTVLAFSKESFPEHQPKSWADFWDTVRFPGARALYDDPRGNLEFALLAAGVNKDSLYPLDIELAFSKLDEIKSSIRVWWNEGTQPVQLLQNRSVVMTSAWNGRIFAIRQETDKIGYSWMGAAQELDWWVIPKGSGNAVTASRFITFASFGERMANQAELIGYGPVNMDALRYLTEDIQSQLPTFPSNWSQSFVVNSDWWADNESSMMKRWVAWKNK